MEFKRERRYITFKLSDLGMGMREHLTQTEDYVGRIRESAGKERRQFLVIESDWPEFEPAWDAIQRRMEGRPAVGKICPHGACDDLKGEIGEGRAMVNSLDAEVGRLTVQRDALHAVVAVLAAMADVSDEKLIELLDMAKSGAVQS